MKRLWAKTNPPHALYKHMIDSGCVCIALLEESSVSPIRKQLEELLGKECLINTVAFLIALHDLGKCHPLFQGMNQEMSEGFPVPVSVAAGSYRHESGSKKYVIEDFLDKGFEEDISVLLGEILRLHHEKSEKWIDVKKEYHPDVWDRLQRELFELMEDVFRPNLELFEKIHDKGSFGVLVWGLCILSDWIASSQPEFCEIGEVETTEEYFEKSHVVAGTAVKEYGLGILDCGIPDKFEELFEYLHLKEQRPLQKACVEMAEKWKGKQEAPLLTIIEAPMGEGKTESAIYLASHLIRHYGKTGMYFALPTGATSNQMYERVSTLLEHHGIGKANLLHSTAWLVDEFTKNESAEDSLNGFSMPLRRGLLSQFAVGTVDQIMMSVMHIRFSILRLIGAASKVIIIDEVHAYDRYMFTIITRFLEWCKALKIPVVLLSATLPYKRKQEILKIYQKDVLIQEEYPLITTAFLGRVSQKAVSGTGMKQKIYLKKINILDDTEAIAKQVLDKAEFGGAICAIMNSVNESIALYNAVKIFAKMDVLLFHGRFNVKRRAEIEEECLRRFGRSGTNQERNCILIATQVVEQSLDIDFDCMFSAMAPIDLLLQRAGRLHRHQRERVGIYKNAEFIVLQREKGYQNTPTGFIYEPYILDKTKDVLEKQEIISLPEDIRPFVEFVYSGGDSSEEYLKLLFKEQLQESMGKRVEFPEHSQAYFFPCERQLDFFDEALDDTYTGAVSTRLGEPTVRILLLEEKNMQERILQYPTKAEAKELLRQTVSVSLKKVARVLDAVICKGLLCGVMAFATKDGVYYGNRNGTSLRIFHSEELGLVIEEGEREI
ncbi:MAG: CRISPR-associated helicase Cas3' [Clostridia bacterium]|nr:CRISPR-associated helicase Cas3' [Clostridia bacterium]